MQPLTEQQTQRVWSRVMNAQAVPAAQMNEQTGSGSAAADSLTPEKLLELIRDERADSALYAHLACRMKGRALHQRNAPPALFRGARRARGV